MSNEKLPVENIDQTKKADNQIDSFADEFEQVLKDIDYTIDKINYRRLVGLLVISLLTIAIYLALTFFGQNPGSLNTLSANDPVAQLGVLEVLIWG